MSDTDNSDNSMQLTDKELKHQVHFNKTLYYYRK